MLKASPAAESRLIALIEERTGIVLQAHQLTRFRQTVAEICSAATGDIDSCIEALSRHGTDHPIYRQLIAQITVNETYFFRDEAQIAFLRDLWLPELIRRRTLDGSRSLRIWSAASSSGEELYTIAMLLRDLLADPSGWRIRLLGTDIDENALRKAAEGRYSGWSFRCTPDSIRERYFLPQEDGRTFALARDLRSMASFQHLNLATDDFPLVARDIWNFDLILCRNVFIYFSRDTVRQVLSKLAATLAPDGIMMLGASDIVQDEAADLQPRHHGDAFYFIRRDQAEAPRKAAPPLPSPAPLSSRPAALPRGPALAAAALRAAFPAQPSPPAPARPSRPAACGRTARDHGGNALAAAGRRDFAQANAEIAAALTQAPLDPFTHLTASTVHLEQGDLRRAEEHARKAISLDRRLVEGHFRLGHLQLIAGEHEAARKSLENALVMAHHHPARDAVPGHEGMTYGQLAAILKSELAALGNGPAGARPVPRRGKP